MSIQQIGAVDETRHAGIARRVRGLMGEQRLNGTLVGQALQVSNTALSRRLQGYVEFTVGEVTALAQLFDVSEEYLYGFSDARGSSPTPGYVLTAGYADVLPFRRPSRRAVLAGLGWAS